MTPRDSMRLVLALAVAGMLADSEACAREPAWFKEAIARALPALAADAPAVVLYRRVELRLEPDLTAEIHEVQAIRILRASGLDHATFGVTLAPGGQLKRFQVWSWDGRTRRSQADRGDAIETTYTPEGYSDTKRIVLRVPQARAGDVVGAEYTLKQRLWFPSWPWAPQPGGLATARAEFALELPRGWRVEAHGEGVTPHEVPSAEGVHRFEVGPLAAIPDEPHSPPRTDVAPLVRLRFLDPDGAHTFATWKSVATWYQRLAAPRYDPRLAPDELTRGVTGDDPSRVVYALARTVQRSVHYAAIELGLQGWIPDASADTWLRRYGDCKDKATLLVAALGARGCVARPVLVCTRDVRGVNPESPDPGQFNHCIVAIAWPGAAAPAAVTATGPSGRAWTFFDPTDPYTPLGMLPRGDAGTWAVIADSTEGIVRLPAARERTLRARTRMRVGDTGDLSGTVTLVGGGEVAVALARDFDEASRAQREQRAAAWLRSPSSRPEVAEVRWSGFDAASFSASIEVEFRVPGGARPAGDALMIRPLYVATPRLASPADTTRVLAFILGGPATYEDRFELEVPAGYRADALPAASWSDSIGEYQLVAESGPTAVVLTRQLSLYDDVVPAERYSSVRQLFREVQGGDAAPIVLRR